MKHLSAPFFTKIPLVFYSENRTWHKSLPSSLLIPSRLQSLSLETSTPGVMVAINMHHTELSTCLQWLSYWRRKLHACATLICILTHKYMYIHIRIPVNTVLVPPELPILTLINYFLANIVFDICTITFKIC